MRRSRPSEEQIIEILHQVELGVTVRETCHRNGIARETFYRWRRKYGGMNVSQAMRLTQLEDENRRLRKLVADLRVDRQALKDALSREVVSLAGRRALIRGWRRAFGLSERRACRLAGVDRSTLRYQRRSPPAAGSGAQNPGDGGAHPSSPGAPPAGSGQPSVLAVP